MKVSEVIKELKKLPKDAEVFLVKDWEDCDVDGYFQDLYRLREVTYQVIPLDMGLEWKNVTEVLLDVEPERATFRIEKND